MSAVAKIKATEAVLNDPRLSQTQALVTIGLIVRSDANFANAFPGATTLCRYAKVSKQHTVFAALKALAGELGIISRASRGNGRSNTYTVHPERIVPGRLGQLIAERRRAAQQPALLSGTGPAATHAGERHGLTHAAERPMPVNGMPTHAAERHTIPPPYPEEREGTARGFAHAREPSHEQRRFCDFRGARAIHPGGHHLVLARALPPHSRPRGANGHARERDPSQGSNAPGLDVS
jgi:hypothetical protein